MGTYIYTFRTENKSAQLDGQTVSVYAFKYLCRAGDEDDRWGRPTKHGALLRASMNRAEELFGETKPQFIAAVYQKDWEGVTVHANPTRAIWYDSDEISGKPIGFMTKKNGRWQIASEIVRESNPIIGNSVVRCVYADKISDGKIIKENLYWIVDGKRLDLKEFEGWREGVETAWREEYQARQLARLKDEQAAAAEYAAKVAAKNAEIAALDAKMEELKRQRAALAAHC